MSEHDKDLQFADKVALQLDQPVPPEVAARLRAARQEAVYLADTKSTRRTWPLLVPAAGVAAAVFAVVITMDRQALAPLPALGDELELAAVTEMELLEELEMLAWLDDEVLDAG